jgi:hypothetical protein
LAVPVTLEDVVDANSDDKRSKTHVPFGWTLVAGVGSFGFLSWPLASQSQINCNGRFVTKLGTHRHLSILIASSSVARRFELQMHERDEPDIITSNGNKQIPFLTTTSTSFHLCTRIVVHNLSESNDKNILKQQEKS